MKTVLIIDGDLRFAFWLGRALGQAGYEALPAANIENASRLVSELNTSVDVVVISAAITDADPFLTKLRQSQRSLTVIAVMEEPGAERVIYPKADLAEYKPFDIDEDARKEWVGTVQTVLAAREVTRRRMTSTRQ